MISPYQTNLRLHSPIIAGTNKKQTMSAKATITLQEATQQLTRMLRFHVTIFAWSTVTSQAIFDSAFVPSNYTQGVSIC